MYGGTIVCWRAKHNRIWNCIQWEHKVQVNTLIFPALIGGLFDLYLVQQMFRKPQIVCTEARLVISLFKVSG